MHELNLHKIRPEKSDQAIGPELQVTFIRCQSLESQFVLVRNSLPYHFISSCFDVKFHYFRCNDGIFMDCKHILFYDSFFDQYICHL